MKNSFVTSVLVLVVVLGCASFSFAAGNRGLCLAEEKVIFSCETRNKKKSISVCASNQLSSTMGYVQYRFGKTDAIELQYPDKRINSNQSFRYYRYTRPQISFQELRFGIGKVRYIVFDYYNAEDDETQEEYSSSGVKVHLPDGREVVVECSGEVVNQLIDLEEIVPQDEE